MIRRAIVLLLALPLLLAPLAVNGGENSHQVQLRDGSVLKGRVISLDATELILATPYDPSLSIPRDQVAAISFTPRVVAALPQSDKPAPAIGAPPAPAGEGVLEVAIKGDAIRSSSRFRQTKHRQRAEEMNVIHLKIVVDGEVVHQDSDPSIEKEFRDRGWVFLRNSHHFATASIPVSAGKHQVQIIVGNQLDLKVQGEEQPGLVSAQLDIEEVLIRPDKKTRIAVQGKSSNLRYGKYEMELLSRF